MADFNTLIADIRAAIYENTEQAITGDALQDILLEMVTDINAAKADQGDLDDLALAVAGKADIFGTSVPLSLEDNELTLKYDDFQFDLGGDDVTLTLRLSYGLISNSIGVQVDAGDGLTFGDEGVLEVDYEQVQATIPDLAEIRQNAASPLHWLTSEAQLVEEGRVYTGTGILAAPGEFEVIKCYAVNYTNTAQTITCWRYPDTGSNAQTFTLAPFQVLALTCTIDEPQGSIWTASDSHYVREDKVFMATSGTTTAAEIDAALAEGRFVFVKTAGPYYLPLTGQNTNFFFFGGLYAGNSVTISLTKSNNAWGSISNNSLQIGANLTSDIEGNKTSTTKYTSAKGVADYVAATAACSTTIRNIVTLSQAEYDALTEYDAHTFYIII